MAPDSTRHQPPASPPVWMHDTACPDAELVARAQAGDRRAFDEIVERYQTTLYNVVLRVLRNHDDAVDVVQTAFARAWDRLDTFDPSRRFFSWLYRIALNAALNSKAKMRTSTPIEDVELVQPGDGPEGDVTRLEERAAIERAIAKLPEHYREVVLLRHFADLSYDEIAESVGIDAKTVKSRLFTARSRLAEMLRPFHREASA